MKKQIFSLALVLVLCIGLTAPALAYTVPEVSGGQTVTTPDGKCTITNVLSQDVMYDKEHACNCYFYWVPDTGAKIYLSDKQPGDVVACEFFSIDPAGNGTYTKTRKVGIAAYTDPLICMVADENRNIPDCYTPPGLFGMLMLLGYGATQSDAVSINFVKTDSNGVPETVPAFVNRFADVYSTSWYANAVTWAVEKGITTGTGDHSFSPDRACTRGEIITFLWRATGEPSVKIPVITDKLTWNMSDFWAYEIGLVDDSYAYRENVKCTRADAVTYIWKAIGSPPAENVDFADIPIGADYAPAVAWAVAQGITTGTGDGTTFSPNDTCTRAEIVTFLYRALGK